MVEIVYTKYAMRQQMQQQHEYAEIQRKQLVEEYNK